MNCNANHVFQEDKRLNLRICKGQRREVTLSDIISSYYFFSKFCPFIIYILLSVHLKVHLNKVIGENHVTRTLTLGSK